MGQKKKSMAINFLVRDCDHEIMDKSMIDISLDVHIKKVFYRTGLVNEIEEQKIINRAKELSPKYPGILDLPCWIIGRTWCKPKDPIWDECVLNKHCKKVHLELIEF